MKKINFLRIILPLLTMLFSCQNTGHGNRILDLDGVTSKVLLYPSELENISISEFIDTVWYIPLETSENMIIGRIDKICFTDDRIFISDTEITHSLFCFDYSGKVLFRIQDKGRGPNQYLTLTNFDIDHDNEEVLIYDAQQKAFMKYNFSGRFISRHTHGFVFDDFRILRDNKVIAYSQYIPNPLIQEQPNSSVFIFDYRSRKPEESLLIFDEKLSLFNKIQGLINYISSRELTHYFYDYFTNSFYSFDEGFFYKIWEIDFGARNIPVDFWNEATFNSHMESIRNGQFCGGIINFQVIEDWIIGLYSCLSRSNIFLYNLETKAGYLLNETIANGKSGFPLFLIPPFHSTGNEIVNIIEPTWIAKLNNSNVPEGIIPDVLMSVGINNNPILQITKLK